MDINKELITRIVRKSINDMLDNTTKAYQLKTDDITPMDDILLEDLTENMVEILIRFINGNK